MNNIEQYKKLLSEFVTIQSVSGRVEFEYEVTAAAEWVHNYFKTSGFETKTITGYGNPIVYAEYMVDPGLETLLIYGHYDVQPANAEDGWVTDPFQVTESGGRLYGRGTADNKGQVLIHMMTAAELIKTGDLKYNIKFVVEGEEEVGSANFEWFAEENVELLACDFYMISDGEFMNGPILEASFRGITNLEINLSVADDDVHSGTFGGIRPNAAEEAARIIAKLQGDGIGNFEILEWLGEADDLSDKWDRAGLRTSMEVTGVQSGYTGEGYKNAIPAKATVKINFRLRPELEPTEFLKLLNNKLDEVVPEYVNYEVSNIDSASGVMLDLDNKFVEQCKSVVSEVYGEDMRVFNHGAIIPAVKMFADNLQVPAVIFGLANEDCGMHSASENIELKMVEKGFKLSRRMLGK